MSTYMGNRETVSAKWYVVDAAGKILGRLATQIASYLRGKHKPEYTPHANMGDFIVVINAQAVRVTGQKVQKKAYHHYSGYPGGLKTAI